MREIESGDEKTQKSAEIDEKDEKNVEIASGSVWRDTQSENWVEYVVLRVAEGRGLFETRPDDALSGRIDLKGHRFVVYQRISAGQRGETWYVRQLGSFVQRFRLVHGPVERTRSQALRSHALRAWA